MLKSMLSWVHRTNRMYDDLDDKTPSLRFLLFIMPMVIAAEIDLILIMFGFIQTGMIMYITMGIMGAWRLIGYHGRK